jgi:hypothetical protein
LIDYGSLGLKPFPVIPIDVVLVEGAFVTPVSVRNQWRADHVGLCQGVDESI